MSLEVNLDRKFVSVSENELQDMETTLRYSQSLYGSAFGWDELLKHRRVIILAEGGTGKTFEMKAKAKALQKNNQFAFFIPIERLANKKITKIIHHQEQESFNTWLSSSEKNATFFLDSVDELKLKGSSFEDAFANLARSVSRKAQKVNLVISCRPNDWLMISDKKIIDSYLPLSTKVETSESEVFENINFEESLKTERKTKSSKNTDTIDYNQVSTVCLLPMNEKQIIKFSRADLGKKADAFINEVRQKNAWLLLRRPLDLSSAIRLWKQQGIFGSLKDQLDMSVEMKLQEPPQRDNYIFISQTDSKTICSKIAAALTLGKKRTLLNTTIESFNEYDLSESIDPLKLLNDLEPKLLNSVLRAPIFEAASIYQLRFHRETQEYLTSLFLKRLNDIGMSNRHLFQLLFAETYGVKVVIPSMKSVAAWVSLWNDDVKNELIAREPEILIELGDPSSLTVNDRTLILRSFVKKYGKGSHRGIHLSLDQIRRLADDGLSQELQSLWKEGSKNYDSSRLLIDIICEGGIISCANILKEVIADPSIGRACVSQSIISLFKFNELDFLKEVVSNWTRNVDNIKPSLITSVIPDLFPSVIGMDALMLFAKNIKPDRGSLDIAWSMERAIGKLPVDSVEVAQLMTFLTELIEDNITKDSYIFSQQSSHAHLTGTLSKLVVKKFKSIPIGDYSSKLIRACIVAVSFKDYIYHNKDSYQKLCKIIPPKQKRWRSKAFKEIYSYFNKNYPDSFSQKECWHVAHDIQSSPLIAKFKENDLTWLVEYANQDSQSLAEVSTAAICILWNACGRSESKLNELRNKLSNDDSKTYLEEYVAASSNVKEPKWKLEQIKREKKLKKKEIKRIKGWKKWKKKIENEPEKYFSDDYAYSTLDNLYRWLSLQNQGSDYCYWNSKILVKYFGETTAKRFSDLIKGHWRTVTIKFWSEEEESERNKTSYFDIWALNGVKAESENIGWLDSLTQKEIIQASKIAIIQLNNFPDYFHEICSKNPNIIFETFNEELATQLKHSANVNYLSLLNKISYAPIQTQKIFKKTLLNYLSDVSNVALPQEEKSKNNLISNWDRVLSTLIKIFVEDRSIKSEIVTPLVTILTNENFTFARNLVLQNLFLIEPSIAFEALSSYLKNLKLSDSDKAISILGSLFSIHRGVGFKIEDKALQAQALSELIRYAYKFIRPEDDVVHEGAYTPDDRDNAESARSALLQMLIETPGVEARDELLKLMDEPDLAHIREFIEMSARRRSAVDSENPSLGEDELLRISEVYETPPKTVSAMHTVLRGKLDDLNYDLRNHPLSDRESLLKIVSESDMQVVLANRINFMSSSIFDVYREVEVVNQKKPDIIIASKYGIKAAIEIKIADKRMSVDELKHAIKYQLVQQYLAHDECQIGCLLLTNHIGAKDRKKTRSFWRNPSTNKRMNWEDLLKYLSKYALELENEIGAERKIFVQGIDLSPTKLVPAHKN